MFITLNQVLNLFHIHQDWKLATAAGIKGSTTAHQRPGTPGDRNWKSIALPRSSGAIGSVNFRVLLDINYGLGDRIQLKYQVPYLFDSDRGAPFKGGVGNSLVEVKWRLYEQNIETGWHLST
jgi:hypothetical protein